jgi:hypothetical protein
MNKWLASGVDAQREHRISLITFAEIRVSGMQSETRHYRDYEIQITNNAPVWQAAIYPTKAGMVQIDWENEPI